MDDWLDRLGGDDIAVDGGKPTSTAAFETVPDDGLEPASLTGAAPEVRAGEEVDYAVLFEEERPHLLKIARAIIRTNCSDTQGHGEDVVHDGFYKVLHAEQKRERRLARDHAFRLVSKAVRQEARRHRTRCRREQPFPFDEKPRDPEGGDGAPRQGGGELNEIRVKTSKDPTEMLMSLIAVRELYNVLNVTDRDLYLMYVIEGLKLKQIAERRGCSVPAVQRAIEKLRRELGMQDYEESPPPDADG